MYREHVLAARDRKRRSRPRWRVAAALFGLVFHLYATAAEGQPAIEVIEAGWDGTAVPSTWTPVHLRVTGGARDMRVLAEVIVDMEFQTGPRSTAIRFTAGSYGRELALPAGESRDLTVWFPADGDGSERPRARLTESGDILAETDVSIRAARRGWPLIAVIAEGPALARTLRGIQLPYQGLPIPLAVAQLTPAAIPPVSGRLEAISALVVQGSSAAELTQAQREAVLAWVRGGGHLVLAGGPGAGHASRVLPDGSLPITAVGVQSAAQVDALGGWLGRADVPSPAPIAVFRTEGGAVLAGTSDAPLAWRIGAGNGTVTLLAVDPALEPIASWVGAATLLRAALAPALDAIPDARWAGVTGQARASTSMWGIADMLPADAHPGWRVAAVILILFALAVGPVLYFVLSRADRRELSWIAVPIAALGVTAGIYVSGVTGAGKDRILNIASFIDINADGRSARQTTLAAIYAPMHSELSVPLPGDVLVRAAGGRGDMAFLSMPTLIASGASSTNDSSRQAEPPFQIIDGASRRARFIGGWSGMRQVLLESDLADAPRIHAEITVEDDLLVGTVRNESTLPLEDAAVIAGGNAVRLGPIAPGQSVPIRLDPDAPRDVQSRHEPLSSALFSEPATRRGGAPVVVPAGFPEPRIMPSDPETHRRARFVDQLLMGYNPRMAGWRLPLTFIAFTRASTAADALPLDGGAVHQLTLLRKPLELRFEPGPFMLPAGLSPPDVQELSSSFGLSGSNVGPDISVHEIRDGSITYAFRPPLPATARAQTLVVTTEQVGRAGQRATGTPASPPNRDDTVGPAAEGVFSVYNWDAGEWTPLPEGSEHRLDGGAFTGPEGVVRVRVLADEGRVVRYIEPSLAIEGRVGAGSRP